MSQAELEIKVIDRKIETKADAFWFGVAEAAGKMLGFFGVLFIFWCVMRILGVLPLDP